MRLDPDGGAWRRRDNGLFQLALGIDAQKRTEWQEASKKSQALAARRGQDLLSGLGFTVERLDNLTLLHRGKVRRSALAVLVDPSELPEAGVPRFNNLPPISYALAKADSEGLPWVVMVHGDRLRLDPTSVGVGVGRRGPRPMSRFRPRSSRTSIWAISGCACGRARRAPKEVQCF